MNTRIHNSNSSAFSLVEAAIVLGVVGLIIGGIWVAAAQVTLYLQTSRAVSGIMSIKDNMQRLISRRDSCAMGDNVYPSDLVGIGIVPDDWEQGSTIIHPFGGTLSIKNMCTSGARFDLIISGLKKAQCFRLLRAIPQGLSTNWNDGVSKGELIYINAPGFSTTTFPATVPDTACGNASNTVYLTYGYTRIN